MDTITLETQQNPEEEIPTTEQQFVMPSDDDLLDVGEPRVVIS